MLGDILCEMYDTSDVLVNAQSKKIHTHPQAWHNIITSIVKCAIVDTNVVNTLTQLGYTSDLEEEAGLSSATRKMFLQMENNYCRIGKIVN